jgi:hypothetical protein
LTAGADRPGDFPPANMLWIGKALGPIERACMRSVMACGHRLKVWSYGALDGLPAGAEPRDAGEVVPAERVFRQVPTGSYALFSNLFRYRLLQRSEGLWLDCDVYLFKPMEWGDGHVFGWERPGVVGSAVLALPAESPALEELIAYFGGVRIPPWLPPRWRARFAMERALKGRYRVDATPWGHLGPIAVTRMIEKHRLVSRVRPEHFVYPIRYEETDLVFAGCNVLDERIKPETHGIHLFNEMLVRAHRRSGAPGSFYERLVREGA